MWMDSVPVVLMDKVSSMELVIFALRDKLLQMEDVKAVQMDKFLKKPH